MKWLRVAVVLILVVVAAFSGYHVYQELSEQKEQYAQEELFRQLAETASEQEPEPERETSTPKPTPSNTPAESIVESEPEQGSTPESPYAFLHEQNRDMVGWISIDGTQVDYPVMQTKEFPNYYLRKNFYGEYSACGSIYAQEDCDVENGGNVILYGHNMKNSLMFGSLRSYKKQSFFEENRYIQFDTLTQSRQYEIMAVFQTTADSAGFPYTAYANLDTEDRFNEYVSESKNRALYETGVDASYGDKLLTLSTCDYFSNYGRLVIVSVCHAD